MLLVLSWNSLFRGSPSPALMILIWMLIAASGIFLFMLAVKKAHQRWIDEAGSLEQQKPQPGDRSSGKKDRSPGPKTLDSTSAARKLVSRIPESSSLEEMGGTLLQYLARDLEIMSGIFYVKTKEQFEATSTYATVTAEEPYSFREGEGLSGQAAKNRQVMVLTQLPEEHMEVYSGLGRSKPAYLAIVPLVHRNRTVAVLECSGYRYDPHDIEHMFRIFSRELMQKLSPDLS